MSAYTVTATDHGEVTVWRAPNLRAAMRLRKRLLRSSVAVAISPLSLTVGG